MANIFNLIFVFLVVGFQNNRNPPFLIKIFFFNWLVINKPTKSLLSRPEQEKMVYLVRKVEGEEEKEGRIVEE